MHPTTKSASGTSFFKDIITTNLFNIKQGIPDAIDNGGDGGYKCHHSFVFEMDNGEIVTLYDYKEGYITDLQIIDWHIGGHSREATSRARKIFESLIINIILV